MHFSSSRLKVRLLTDDIERSQHFYQQILDARYESSDGEVRQLSVAGQPLTLIQRMNGRGSVHAGSMQLLFRAPFTATELRKRADRFGITIERAADNAYRLSDPDGNELLLYTNREPTCCEDEECPWDASVFHVLVAHRTANPNNREGE